MSPQHNGVTDILVKSAKKVLYRIFNGKRFTETELTTALKQAEMQLNARPLLAISDSPSDNSLLSITPAHLVLGRSLIQIPSSLDKLKLDKLKTTTVTTRWEARKYFRGSFIYVG